MDKLVKSPLRYPGGKSRALKQILPRIPVNISEFREPFVGGDLSFLPSEASFKTALNPIGSTISTTTFTVFGNRQEIMAPV